MRRLATSFGTIAAAAAHPRDKGMQAIADGIWKAIEKQSSDAKARMELTTVLEPGPEYKILAVNQLDDELKASPAVAGRAFFVRTRTHLYRIEQ